MITQLGVYGVLVLGGNPPSTRTSQLGTSNTQAGLFYLGGDPFAAVIISANFEETVTVTDSLTAPTIRSRSFSEVVTVNETFSSSSLSGYFTETVTITDTHTATGYRSSFVETVSVSDAFTSTAVRNKTFTETVSILDVLSSEKLSQFNETVTVTDTVTSTSQKTFTEAVTISETLTTHYAIQNYTFNEPVFVVETFDTVRRRPAVFSEASVITDGFSSHRVLSASFSETVTMTESFTQASHRAFAESMSITETFTTAKIGYSSFTETVSLTDTFSRQKISHSVFTEPVAVLEKRNVFDVVVDGFLSSINRDDGSIKLTGKSTVLEMGSVELGDTEAGGTEVVKSRSMSGQLRTYVKKQSRHHLHYTLEVAFSKAVEYQRFTRQEIGNVITLENWKGEKWVGYLATNPNKITTVRRGELTKIEVDFDGVRVL